MDTLCTTERESNLTITMPQDISTFDGQVSSKLEDWFMHIETAAVIQKDTHAYLRSNEEAWPAHSSVRPLT